MNISTSPRLTRMVALAAVTATAFSLAACAPPGADEDGEPVENTLERPGLADDETTDGFDLDALVEAAQQEGPITIYDETGKVVQIAKAFTEKYGIEATGVKVETNVVEKARQEYEANNVVGDVIANSEIPSFYSELFADGVLTSWVPGDLYDSLPDYATYPFLGSNNQFLWGYNTEAYPNGCPVTNIWELTDDDYTAKVALPDPLSRGMYTTWWNQAANVHADEFEAAYEDYFGEPLETDQPTAAHEWVKRLAENSPVTFKNDEEVSDAFGAPGQDDPPIGLTSAAKYRNNSEKGYVMAPCDTMEPFAGFATPQTMAYATRSESPNAAKLYIHFATSQEGMDFIMPDGKSSYSPLVTPPSDEYGIIAMRDSGAIQPYDTEHLQDDFMSSGTWQDLWRSSR